jgi:uncharacterized repeat protein (TIGR01451 family)
MQKKYLGLGNLALSIVALTTLGHISPLKAHSVGQVQTTKFFAPDTVQLLRNRAIAGAAGLQVGDTVTYYIQFSPVGNGAITGVAGYITDYIPAGVEVVDAAIVTKDAAGNFTNIAPSLPGGIDTGWGNRGQRTYLAPFNVATYDATGRCTTAGFTNNCDGRLTELHADTGIFFSTDARTAQFPAPPQRIEQGTNGYNISPTAEGQLNPIIGQTNATTHNVWDANMTNAFGSAQADINATLAPKSSQIALMVGTGAAPYRAASPVAGPQTGYDLDYLAAVGPWQRIAYPGSRIGDPTNGPATAAGASLTGVGGLPTTVGAALSAANPLPANTNAVRWAVGKLVVGETRYVKISMRLTAPVSPSGLYNASEVFGGDAGDGDNGQDNPWRYHVPSVADNNSNLFLYKEVICVYSGATCVPSDGNLIPVNAKIRYRISYVNIGNSAQTNVVLQDILPCATAANSVTLVTVVSGPIGLPTPNPPLTAAGNCTNGTRSTVSFPLLASLNPGVSGAIDLDIQTNAALDANVANTAKLTSAQIPLGITSNTASTVSAAPLLVIEKATSTPVVSPGGTVTYTLHITNDGTTNATNLNIYDELPSLGGVLNAANRWSFLNTVSVVPNAGNPPGSVLPAPTVTTAIPPTLTPYSTAAGAANAQEVRWSFGATSILVPGAGFTITFTATVGASVPVSTTPYLNSAVATYTGGVGRNDLSNAAPVMVASIANLTVTKSNAATTLMPGATTTYSIVLTNAGPAAANGALLRDPVVAGLVCASASCAASAGAVCPAPLDINALQGAGVVIPTLPSGGTITVLLNCSVSATGQ